MKRTGFEPVHFLLVDDLEENLLALEALLRRDCLVLLKARSGREALELLLKHDIALALIDVQMPEMSGFELAEFMRGIERTRTVPIIFLTAGSADQQRRFRGYGTGAVDFLQKPIEPDVLKSKAGVFFELHRRRQEVAQHAQLLEEADRRKDEFIATLAHELRNPLTPLRNGLEVLRRDPTMETSGKIRDMMDRQLRHMVRLIDDLLDTSRISEGKIALKKEKINLRSIVDNALETSQPQIEEGKHVLTVDIADDDIWIDGDLTRLAQTVSNLLINAAKYTSPGGRIRLHVAREADMAAIRVADNGFGIRKDMLLCIFDLFTQAGNASARSGLGIGLALVRHLVEMHGGSIRAESEGENKGSTFTIFLPITEAPQEIADETDPAQDDNGPALRVLVVDDNKASAQTTAWMLELYGHSPMLAYDGQQALALARSENPEVIFLDIGLPDISGYEVCRQLRTEAAFKDTCIIAQTGWGQQRDRELAAEAGFNHHLVKPASPEDYKNILSQLQTATS